MNQLAEISPDKKELPGANPEASPPAVDAVVHISTADHGLTAILQIEPPTDGGAAPTLELLETALAGNHICSYVDTEQLKELAAKPVYGCDIVIARGIAPVNGEDGTVAFRIGTGKKSLTPKENENGLVDFRDLGLVENVRQDQVLCTVTPPTNGSPGSSVTGKELLQRKGKPAPDCAGKNTAWNEERTALLAQIDGQVEFDGHKIHVNETFYVRGDIDSSTGNVKVANNLAVLGAVLPGFQIQAGGTITVSGVVENAAIRAGGSVKLQSGMTGSELYCEGDLTCSFIENCTVFVKGDLIAEYILNSNIKCGKNLKTVGKRAKIIGGNCVAGENIEAVTIGSTANVKTRLELGTDCTVIERQQELMTMIPDLEEKIEKIKPLLILLRQLETGNRLPADKKDILKQAEYSYETSMKLQEAAKNELEEIAQLISSRGYGRVICRGTMHPGTAVTIGTANLSVTEAMDGTQLYYNAGTICKGSACR